MKTKPLSLKHSVLGLLLGMSMTAQAEITLQKPTIVNVTPAGFSVIWETDVIAEPRIAIFQDSAGTVDITNQLEVIINSVNAGDPSIDGEYVQDQFIANSRDIHHSLGQNMVEVRGAAPDTLYYFKIYSENTQDSGVWPLAADVFSEVGTESENSFLSESNQLLVSVGHESPFGWLMTVSHTDTNHSVATRVGDGANSQQGYLNLSNLFTASGSNWMPVGSEVLTIDIWSGFGTHYSQDVSVDFTGEFSVSTLRNRLINIPIDNHIIMTSPGYPYYSTGELIALQWQDQADSINAAIDLYYDTDNTGADGIQITSGINEDPDGVGDQYQWDTVGINDGIYYPYAQMDAGSGPITSYAPGAIAIDRAGIDSDGDLLPDLWEQLFFGSLDKDGIQDSDNDGSGDNQEFQDNTDPSHPDIKLVLKAGLNIISFPMIPGSSQTTDFLALLGSRINSIKYLNTATNLMSSAPADSFILQSGHGYMIDMAEDAEIIIRGSLAASDSKDLVAGTNLIGFREVPEGYSAFQLLQDIGSTADIASIQQFNAMTGRYDIAAYDNAGVVSGKDFAVIRGEGYIVAMKQAVNGFVIPVP